MNRIIYEIEGLEKSLAELKAIGRNLNQLTVLCNMGKIQALELAEIKRQFGAVVESITGLKAGKTGPPRSREALWGEEHPRNGELSPRTAEAMSGA